MSYSLVTAPEVEPLTADDVLAYSRFFEDDFEATLIESLIVAARRHVEQWIGLSLMTQTWKLSMCRFPPCSAFELNHSPVQEISHIKYYSNDVLTTLSADNYSLESPTESRAKVHVARDEWWPCADYLRWDAVQVTFVAGFGDDPEDVPEDIRQAIRQLVLHFLENREAAQEKRLEDIPFGISSLLAPYISRHVW